MDIQATAAKTFCNVLALQKGLDPAGSASPFQDLVLIETRLPWKNSIYSEPGALPAEMIALMEAWLRDYQAGLGYPHRPLMIAPDAEYSVPGFRRVMYYSRPSSLMAQYDKVEYLVPEEALGGLLWSLFKSRESLLRYEQYRQREHEHIRDLLVCTHGTIDSACAKFGYPLYSLLRNHYAHDRLRAWRVSHFGGHVFAPTLMEMPTGHFWAYVEADQAQQIVERSGDAAALRGHYRGCAAFEHGFMQAAEGEVWQRMGWRWFEYRKSGVVLAQGEADEAQWAQIRIDYASPDGRDSGAYDVRVELRQHIETIHTTGNPATFNYPQYVVASVREIASEAAYAVV